MTTLKLTEQGISNYEQTTKINYDLSARNILEAVQKIVSLPLHPINSENLKKR